MYKTPQNSFVKDYEITITDIIQITTLYNKSKREQVHISHTPHYLTMLYIRNDKAYIKFTHKINKMHNSQNHNYL